MTDFIAESISAGRDIFIKSEAKVRQRKQQQQARRQKIAEEEATAIFDAIKSKIKTRVKDSAAMGKNSALIYQMRSGDMIGQAASLRIRTLIGMINNLSNVGRCVIHLPTPTQRATLLFYSWDSKRM
jgi:hypothetical protein